VLVEPAVEIDIIKQRAKAVIGDHQERRVLIESCGDLPHEAIGKLIDL
jgi:hypothetical protein